MALTVTRRAATTSDADLDACVAGAKLAGTGWDVNGARAYVLDPQFHLVLVEATWPERGINSPRIVAFAKIRRRTATRAASIDLLAIDPALIPQTQRGARIRIADELLRRLLDDRSATGHPSAVAKTIVAGSPVDQYINTLPFTSRVVVAQDAVGNDIVTYTFDLLAIKAALDAASRANLYTL